MNVICFAFQNTNARHNRFYFDLALILTFCFFSRYSGFLPIPPENTNISEFQIDRETSDGELASHCVDVRLALVPPYLFIHLFICLFIYLFFHLFVCLFIYLFCLFL